VRSPLSRSDGPNRPVLAIFGPTAAGKSALAHAAARATGAEIVVADPFQRYRGLEVAADSPSAAERREVTYHLVGDLDLTEQSSAGDYAPKAHAAIDDIRGRGLPVIVTGGTGLYLRAALADLAFPAETDVATRQAVEQLVDSDPSGALAELIRVAPDVASRIDQKNPRRVARALMLARSGQPARPPDALWTMETRHATVLVGVSRPRPVLDALIGERVERERDDGLLEELQHAIDTPGFSRSAAQIIGVKEVLALRSGEVARDELSTVLAARTRRLARAQLTWIRKTPGVQELPLGEAPATEALDQLMVMWDGGVRSPDRPIGYAP
jgi:tRNA dimethylallyltransferase